MAAADYFVHRHHDTMIPEDHLDVWRPIRSFDATLQIDQANGVSAAVGYRAEHAPALARAILEAVGLDPRTVFLGDLPGLSTEETGAARST